MKLCSHKEPERDDEAWSLSGSTVQVKRRKDGWKSCKWLEFFSFFFLLSIFTLIHSPCFIWINCLACVLNSGENIYLFFLGGRIWRHWVLHLNILAWFIHFACVRIYMMLAALKSSTRRKTRFSSPTSFSSRDGSIMRLIGAIQLYSSCNSLGTVSGPWVRVCPEVIELAMLSPLS